MTLMLTLSPELERRLAAEAGRKGISADQYALSLLENSLASEANRTELIGLLQCWIEEAESGKKSESDVDMTQMLDADRLSDRKLFPPELKGVTW